MDNPDEITDIIEKSKIELILSEILDAIQKLTFAVGHLEVKANLKIDNSKIENLLKEIKNRL